MRNEKSSHQEVLSESYKNKISSIEAIESRVVKIKKSQFSARKHWIENDKRQRHYDGENYDVQRLAAAEDHINELKGKF